MSRIGFLLSGAGFQDGTEIQEAVIAMLALQENGAELVYFSTSGEQAMVVNHQSGASEGAARDVLVESARITRGEVHDVATAKVESLDGLVIPGGYGAALNLCDFGSKQADMNVNPDVEKLIHGMHAAKKPIGAMCIAPVLVAKVLGVHKPRVTVGNDPETAAAIEKMGATHVDAAVDAVVVDEDARVVSTPAYMLAQGPQDLHKGIRKLAEQVIAWTKA